MPSFLNTSEWVGIGTPNLMEQNKIPAQNRFESNTIYDYPCEEDNSVLSVKEESIVNLYVFPNPTVDLLHVKSDVTGSITILDINGKSMGTTQIVVGLTKINVRSYPKGVYRLNLKNLRNEMIKQANLDEKYLIKDFE